MDGAAAGFLSAALLLHAARKVGRSVLHSRIGAEPEPEPAAGLP